MMKGPQSSLALGLMLALGMLLAIVGCSFKPGYLKGDKTDVPNRWKVEGVTATRLTDDQRQVFEGRGAPTYVRFFREVETRKPVYTWIYVNPEQQVDLVWFIDGQRVDNPAVDSEPSAYRSTTRRRARLVLLSATGAAILPAVILLAK
jgi:hypothetical protein